MGVFTRRPSTGSPDSPRLRPVYLEDGATALAADAPRPILGAGKRIRVVDPQAAERFQRAASADSDWQRRAWGGYEGLGEIHFAFNVVGNVISRIRFYPAADVSSNVAPAYVDDLKDLTPGLAEAAKAAMRRISDTQGDFSSLARHLAINLSVPGECYLVQIPARPALARGVFSSEETRERWEIRSKEEVIVSTDKDANIKLRARPDDRESEYITLPKEAFVARIWRRNPRFSALADSSMRPLLDQIDELALVNETFKATARSRLNSGVLFVPDGLTASTPQAFPDPALEGIANAGGIAIVNEADVGDIDDFEESFLQGMMTPILQPGSHTAVVPILVRGPSELGEKIRLIQFERTFDPALVQRSDRLLERILQGLDLPKDIVAGLANVRYSNAVTIEDSLFKAHIEPLTLLICDALTDVYLRPALVAMGYTPEQAARCRIWYDPSEVVSRPNRNQDAIAAYDRYALSSRSLREANGFNESDAPSPSEIILRMLLQKGPIGPELSEALMRAIAPLMMNTATDAAQANSDNPLPPEVQELLNPGSTTPDSEPLPESEAEEEVLEEEAPPAPPAEPAPPAPRAPNARGPRGGRPAETPIADGVSLLPPPQS